MRSRAKAAALALGLLASVGLASQPAFGGEDAASRPQPPRRPALPVVSEADCDVPERREALVADPEAAMQAASSYGRALNHYSERLMEWRSDRFIRAGRWTAADKNAFGMRILQDPDFSRELEQGMRLVGGIMEPAMVIGDEARPAIDRCLALLAIQQAFDGITASVEAQWVIIDRLFAAEAQRLGVTLD